VSRDDGLYRLVYTKGAQRLKNFNGLGRMSQLDKEYVSSEIFPLLANRVLPKNRPEHREYLSWLGLSESDHDELEELARTGGLRATDSIELIPCPEPTDDEMYEVYFFSRGLSHFLPEHVKRVNELSPGDTLYMMKDFQNERDPRAMLLRTLDPISLVGYAPMYYAQDFGFLAEAGAAPTAIRIQVDRVNPDAPLQYRLLCRMTTPWPKSFNACESELFQPIAPIEAMVE
jgi:hypothetical protein